MWQCFFMWRDTANDISNKLSTNEQLVADSLTQHWSQTTGVIKLPKYMVILGEFPYKRALFGLVT